MGKFGGFGGGNMQQLMKQAQRMQQDMAEAQEKLSSSEVTASVSGGLVEVDMLGSKVVTAIRIKKEAVDIDDIEMLEDLILAALNDATAQIDKLNEELLGPYASMAGGLF